MENRATDMQEEWIIIEDDKIPEGQYTVTTFVQNLEGTKIVLDDEINIVEIFFDGVPFLLRICEEGVRMRTWGEVQFKYQDKFFFRNHFFYQVQNSALTKWTIEESCGFFNEEQLKHYCVVTSEEIIDIIASFEPIVTVSMVPLVGH